MIQLLPTMTARDVQQWIGGGVCLLDRTRVVKYITISRDKVVLRDVTTGLDNSIELPSVDRLSAYWPRCGSLNVTGGAIYLLRTQQQQYRRTYNPRALTVIYPDKWAMLKVDSRFVRRYADPMNEYVIKAAFNPVYPSWDEAMEMLRTQPNVAISEQIILGGMPDLLTVYHRGKKCGTVVEGVFTSIGKGLPSARAYKLLQGRITLC